MTPTVRNIGPAGRRRRYLMAGALLVVGAALTLVLIVAGSPRGYRLALALPFAVAALAFFQARAHT
jgi:fatty acid desaturase